MRKSREFVAESEFRPHGLNLGHKGSTSQLPLPSWYVFSMETEEDLQIFAHRHCK